MAYEKQNFESGEVLTAAKLNLMDDQIAKNELISGTTIKTINNETILGPGNITIDGITDGKAFVTSLHSNNIYFNDNDGLNDTGDNYMNFWPAGSTIDRGCKTFYRFMCGDGNMNITDNDIKSKLFGLSIGPAIPENIDKIDNTYIDERDIHLDVLKPDGFSSYTPCLYIGNANNENVFVFGGALYAERLENSLNINVNGITKSFNGSSSQTIDINTNSVDYAKSAGKVNNKLSINVNGTIKSFDGSSSETIDINTNSVDYANSAGKVANKLTINVDGTTKSFDGSSSQTIDINTINNTVNLQDLIPSGKGLIIRLMNENEEIEQNKYLTYSDSGIFYTSILPTSIEIGFSNSGLTVKSVKSCSISSWNVSVFSNNQENRLSITSKDTVNTQVFGIADIILSVSTDGGATVKLARLPLQIFKANV